MRIYRATGSGEGENAPRAAAENALYALYLQHEFSGVREVCVTIYASEDLNIGQVEEICRAVREAADLPSNALFIDLVCEPSLQDKIRVTLRAEFA